MRENQRGARAIFFFKKQQLFRVSGTARVRGAPNNSPPLEDPANNYSNAVNFVLKVAFPGSVSTASV